MIFSVFSVKIWPPISLIYCYTWGHIVSAIFVFQLGAKCANPEVPSPPEDPADPDIDDEFIVVETSRRLTDSGQLFGTPPSRLSSLSPQPAIFASQFGFPICPGERSLWWRLRTHHATEEADLEGRC